MGQTGLMRGVGKLPVRRPAVALEDARIVGAEHPRGLGKAPAVLDRISGRVPRRKPPQPVRMAADFPAGFIGRDDGAAADLGAQRRVRGVGLARRPMDRVDQPAARDGEPETVAEPLDDLAEGEAELFVQDHGERHGLRAELHRGGAERVRRLQRVAPLHAPMAVPALANRHAEFMHHGTLHRQIFLVLGHHAASGDRPAAVRAGGRQGRFMHHVNPRWRAAVRLTARGRARFAARSLGVFFGQPARTRRRLAVGAAARHLELLFQPLVLAPQPAAFDLRPQEVLPQPLDLPRQILDGPRRVPRRRILWRTRHATVMRDSRAQYKREMLGASVPRCVVFREWRVSRVPTR